MLKGNPKTLSEEECDFFSPPLFCSQYLGLGCIFWAAFAPAGQGFAVPGGVYSVSRVLGLSFTGCSLHSQIPAVGHLGQVCRAGAQPHSAPRKGSSCFKKQWWEHSLGYLRNAFALTKVCKCHHPSPAGYFLNSHSRGSSLRDDWNKPCRIWLSCHLLLIINDKSQGMVTNYNVGASYLLLNRLKQN